MLAEAQALAAELADGPTAAHAMTKRQLDAEWAVPIETAIDMEAEAQAELHADQRLQARLRSLRGEADAGVQG